MIEFKKTPAILIASHGNFCEELIRSAQMLYGEMEDVVALPLLVGMDPEEYEKQFNEIIDRYDGDIIVFVDMFGGTPFNTLIKAGCRRQLCAITGVNMTMLFQALDERDTERNGEKLAESIMTAAAAAIKDVTPSLARFYEQAQNR